LFALDGKLSSLTENDIARRNRIVTLLAEWGLLVIVNPDQVISPIAPLSQIKIISHKDKSNWNLEAKYNIGRKINVKD
jgi:hypothetical protein